MMQGGLEVFLRDWDLKQCLDLLLTLFQLVALKVFVVICVENLIIFLLFYDFVNVLELIVEVASLW